MKKKHWGIDSVVVGLALFSTMFGAGNLIFPPQIGLSTGTQWLLGAIGILITGVILPVTAFWAVNNVGDVKTLMGHVHPRFYDWFYVIGCILVGMGSTLPRSGATTHELAIQPLFPNVPIWVTMVVFFALVLFFAFDKNSVVDKLGKYLTPLLLIMLAIVLIKGVVSPIGVPQEVDNPNPVTSAMLTGYLTGDLTVGLMCANIFISGLVLKGHRDAQERKRCGILVGLVSVASLGTIYVMLTYIGATGGAYYDLSTPQTTLLSGLIGQTLGVVGMGCMGLAVGLACLTTAVGIGTTCVGFFYDFFKRKIPYKVLVLIACLIGIFMGITGVQNIVNYVTPIFLVVYPALIVNTVLGLLNKYLPNDGFYKGGVLMAVVVSLGDAVLSVNPNIGWLRSFMDLFPFSGLGFAWVVPTIIGMVVGAIICRGKPKYQPLPDPAEVSAQEK